VQRNQKRPVACRALLVPIGIPWLQRVSPTGGRVALGESSSTSADLPFPLWAISRGVRRVLPVPRTTVVERGRCPHPTVLLHTRRRVTARNCQVANVRDHPEKSSHPLQERGAKWDWAGKPQLSPCTRSGALTGDRPPSYGYKGLGGLGRAVKEAVSRENATFWHAKTRRTQGHWEKTAREIICWAGPHSTNVALAMAVGAIGCLQQADQEGSCH
jgi:hypothetical protein